MDIDLQGRPSKDARIACFADLLDEQTAIVRRCPRSGEIRAVQGFCYT